MDSNAGNAAHSCVVHIHWRDVAWFVTVVCLLPFCHPSRIGCQLKSYSYRFCLALVLMLACPLAWTQAGRPLVLAFSELDPWKIVNGEMYGGAYTEIVRELARRTGLQLRILPCPLKRCLLLLQEGQADIIIGVRASPERAQDLLFLRTPYRKHSSDKVFYVAKGKAATIAQYSDLAGLRIGVKNGVEYFARFDQDRALRKEAVGNIGSNFKKLLLGRLDTVIVAEDQGEALVSSLGIRDQVEKARYREPDPGPRAIAIAKKSPFAPRFEQFEQAMAEMSRDGTLKMLFQHHYFDALHIPGNSVPID